jgi:hypothetical protein
VVVAALTWYSAAKAVSSRPAENSVARWRLRPRRLESPDAGEPMGQVGWANTGVGHRILVAVSCHRLGQNPDAMGRRCCRVEYSHRGQKSYAPVVLLVRSIAPPVPCARLLSGA